MSCKYAALAGIPGQGAHSYRIAGVAAFDLGLTLILAYAFHRLFGIGYWFALLLSLLLGVVAHRLFCVRTAVDRLLFP
jgi:hypothetical protein